MQAIPVQNALVGFLLALVTALMWGVLPIFLKLALQQIDAYTITAYRFLFAAGFVFIVLLTRNGLPSRRQFPGIVSLVLVACTVLLVVNYVANVESLRFVSPDTIAVVMQLAPFMVMLGGVLFFKEAFSRIQLLGAITLLMGLALFFNQRIPAILLSPDEDIIGIALTILAATTWAAYALSQKWLFKSFTSKQLTLLIYVIGFSVLVPFSEFSLLSTLSDLSLYSLLFCCINTVVGYGAFTHAMSVWDASKVSAVIAVTPVFTYFSNKLALLVFPDTFIDAQMDGIAYLGAGLIIAGAITASIGKRQQVICE